jgi:hypothetical protein
MVADRDISGQEAVHLLLGDKLVGCRRTFVNLNAQADAPLVLKDEVAFDNDDRALEHSFFKSYREEIVTRLTVWYKAWS